MSKREIAYELHAPARKNYVRRHVNVYGKNDLWQADLVEMIPHSRLNKGFKYILCVIDCFTKYAWTVPLKSKTGDEVARAMSTILVDRRPKLLQVDRGKEFYNKTFDALMKRYGINMYSTFGTTKASIVERFNRTLKSRMYREFTARGSYDWISILPELMNGYNNSVHRTINMTPMQADNDPASINIHRRTDRSGKIKFRLGDRVRISAYRSVFRKSYLPNWSTEIFTVIKINKTAPPTYQLRDYKGNDIAGCFYAEEIRKTQYPDDYLVEKVLRKKGNKSLVKFLGFEATEWINTADIKK